MKLTLGRSLLVLLVGAALVGGVVWYSRDKAAQEPEQRYKFQEIAVGEVVQSVSANGTLNPLILVNVGTQVSGTVRKLYVDFNDKVEQGQPLLELDQSLLEAQARASAANVANISASLDLAKANEARMKALLEREYVSRQEYDQALQTLRSAQAQLAQAKAAADKDRVNLNYTVITSPVSGVVVARLVDLGQTVAASFQTPTLIQIARDLSKMAIDTSFAEADIGNIREGQKVRFTVDAFPNRNFQGEVKQIRLNPTNQQNVVTYNVRVSVDNPEQVLLPGMTAYTNIAVAKRSDVLLVPNAALRFKPVGAREKSAERPLSPPGAGGVPMGPPPAGTGRKKKEGGGATVYVLENGELKPVLVQVGITDNRNTEVTGGDLKVGAKVAVGEANGAAKPSSSVGMRLF
ncbi:MAG TPA: efflux RND transporter periplasmic adaptor subunit [Rhodocyclaceae bacterium]|nr:efflux RND transporter periplasmic adaptor subunit [Rhodocyclaceae bacterium]HNE43422.1 efflux RND transporter periplasmic adaptor subunit [Rhodocyclaceae bacterium]HNM23010.1 efflux RND transporter periplasmic adaptor subunit [Rhodocyclaceae bacterium]HNM82124.1 efflux RND transporter periplasmic adaptor subunit [Rhodocyclaceae bacterium]HNO87588.1 efflux RND transporter periplasmic adaptor subunit [Rhodocyclaceae bacterium]